MALPARKKPQQEEHPQTDQDSERDPDQAWYWTPEWQEKEHQADEEEAAGRYKDFSTMEDFIADLMSDDEDAD